jgi:hypothetical protein
VVIHVVPVGIRIAGKQEVDVDRVTRAVLHRARGRGKHLGEQLAAEEAGPEVLDAARFEAIVAKRFGVERAEQRLERAGHRRARLPYPKRRVKLVRDTQQCAQKLIEQQRAMPRVFNRPLS